MIATFFGTPRRHFSGRFSVRGRQLLEFFDGGFPFDASALSNEKGEHFRKHLRKSKHFEEAA
jgi:cobalamin biosynthesis protein CobT